MIYVATYLNKHNKPCVRKITQGFACTRQELPRELQTRCRSIYPPYVLLFESDEGADIRVADYVSNGYIDESNLKH